MQPAAEAGEGPASILVLSASSVALIREDSG
jgi:hypothetical protein